MNALTPPIRAEHVTPTMVETPAADVKRRGPFRPKTLVPLRDRKGGDIFIRVFRSIDAFALMAFALFSLVALSPQGILLAPVSTVLPFATMALVSFAFIESFGLYRFGRHENILWHQARLALALSFGGAAGMVICGLSPMAEILRETLFHNLSSVILFFMILHLLWSQLAKRWRSMGKLTPNIVIVGATPHAQTLIESALNNREINILGIFDDRLSRNPDGVVGVPILGDTRTLHNHKIMPFVDQIVVALDPSAKARVRSVITHLKSLPNEVSLLVDIEDELGRKAALRRMTDIPLARMSGVSEDEKRAFNKRVQDLVIGSIALIAFAPIMALTALAIRLEGKGPVFFRQRRHGFNNEPILVWKFRSMRVDREDATASQQVTKDDDRVTRVGKFIRKTSLDELPQLFNVIKGEMSLVGPRPHAIGMKTDNEDSALLVAEYAWRHRMKPGITGWAAINGSRGALQTADDVKRRVTLDIDYIERQNLWLDLYIMAMTVPCILGDSKTIR